MGDRFTLSQSGADIYIPDGRSFADILPDVTHLGIVAHADDLEIAAYHGISACYLSDARHFMGVVVTDGRGSPRAGPYRDTDDGTMIEIRREEQRKAASIGGYAAVAQLNIESSQVKDFADTRVQADLLKLFPKQQLEVVYLHNPFDRHLTHSAVLWHAVELLRSLPREQRPLQTYGSEVWRNLDWLPERRRVVLPVDEHPDLAENLMAAFPSQIEGGKRYDLAVAGRRRANATFSDAQAVDKSEAADLALDLNGPVLDNEMTLPGLMQEVLGEFNRDSHPFTAPKPPSTTFRPRLPDGYSLRYLRDKEVDEALDRELRELLCIGFPGKSPLEGSLFSNKRYNNEMPRHRWIVSEREEGGLVAHFAVHEKIFDIAGEKITVGAIGEVCVRPEHRGQNLVVVMANAAIPVMRMFGAEFGFLMGDPNVYASSGYRSVRFNTRWLDSSGNGKDEFMEKHCYRPLSGRALPEGPIDIQGPKY